MPESLVGFGLFLTRQAGCFLYEDWRGNIRKRFRGIQTLEAPDTRNRVLYFIQNYET
jgi:hypothetical protein